MHQPTQDRPNRNGKTGKAGKVTISRIQVDEGTYKLPKVKSEVVYLGDPRIIGLEDADIKIKTKRNVNGVLCFCVESKIL